MQPTENAAVQVRLSGEEFDSLENWRRAQEKIPPRSEAIREAIRRLVRGADDTPVISTSHDQHRKQCGSRRQKNTVRRRTGPCMIPPTQSAKLQEAKMRHQQIPRAESIRKA